jgi:acid phosphatase family membrane protein YuiD
MDIEHIQRKIHEIRGVKIILDFDLAIMYEVETRALNQAVKRNMKRFPNDFMFQLTQEEWENISSQFVMTSRVKRPKSSMPYAFTEQGVAMLSGLLNSDIAINTNIIVMRAFVMVRQYALNYAELNQKIEKISSRLDDNDVKTNEIFELLKELLEHKKELNPIGFRTNVNS